MGIYLKVIRRKRIVDYLFLDELSIPTYENALFRLHFKYDTLSKEHIEIIEEYLQNMCDNLVLILNGDEVESSETDVSHEDRIKALEEIIASLTDEDIDNLLPKKYGTLKINPRTEHMDFNRDGTILKFTNLDDEGTYTTRILQKGNVSEITLPVGEYIVNIVNSLNDMKDAVFLELWDNAVSRDMNHTMKYTVVEGITELQAIIEYENIN